jgi:hypothetical protein
MANGDGDGDGDGDGGGTSRVHGEALLSHAPAASRANYKGAEGACVGCLAGG